MKEDDSGMPEEDRRDKFLLGMYNAFWSNITRAEEAVWKMLAAYAALFVGLSYAYETLGWVLFSILVILFSFCGVALSLNANLWFVRNINLISNLEKEFLYASDYGVLVPKKYQKSYPFLSRRTFEVWWVLVLLYAAVGSTVLVMSYTRMRCIQTYTEWLWVFASYLVCLILTIMYGCTLQRRHAEFLKAAPGRMPREKLPA